MQTFLPFEYFKKSAKCLDMKRLGKQRVECKQIILALVENHGWINHPAVKMWKGYEKSLIRYAKIICEEWISRGYKDTLLDWFSKYEISKIFSDYCTNNQVKDCDPPWNKSSEFHISHQSNLLRKDNEFYKYKGFQTQDSTIEYVWPKN